MSTFGLQTMSLILLDFPGRPSDVAATPTDMCVPMTPIAPTEIRYIKLGAGGSWAAECLARGEIAFGYPLMPHDLCLSGDWDAVARQLIETDGRGRGAASDAVREIREFYTLGPDCLWITFADRHLWWAFAEPEVIWRHAADNGATRVRKVIGTWRKTSLDGTPLRLDNLSSRLTQVASYRKTICQVKARDYLVRRINGTEEPVTARAHAARAALVAVAGEMIAGLHWADFETLVDLIFARSGWQRVSRVGETLSDVDLILEQPATGETAFVQVKSKANQAVLDDYADRFRRSEAYDRMFFVCHTPQGPLTAAGTPLIHVWTGDRLADAAVTAGLFDWLVERSA